MAITKITPYLNFDGTAAKAIQLYERALGAKTDGIHRFGDIPGNEVAPENRDRVSHAHLQIGDASVMISDTYPGMPFTPGSGVHVCLDFTDVAEMTAKFEALAAGGKVTMAPQPAFWGATFGMLTDAYGVQWMFNCNSK
jgi:PhnB protein